MAGVTCGAEYAHLFGSPLVVVKVHDVVMFIRFYLYLMMLSGFVGFSSFPQLFSFRPDIILCISIFYLK